MFKALEKVMAGTLMATISGYNRKNQDIDKAK